MGDSLAHMGVSYRPVLLHLLPRVSRYTGCTADYLISANQRNLFRPILRGSIIKITTGDIPDDCLHKIVECVSRATKRSFYRTKNAADKLGARPSDAARSPRCPSFENHTYGTAARGSFTGIVASRSAGPMERSFSSWRDWHCPKKARLPAQKAMARQSEFSGALVSGMISVVGQSEILWD